MKYTNNIFTALLFLGIGVSIVSCDRNKDDLSEVRSSKPTISLDKIAATLTEGDEITFTVNSEYALTKAADFKLQVNIPGSTANFRDFSAVDGEETTISGDGYAQGQIGYTFKLPAFNKQSTFTLKIDKDLLIEGNETLQLRLVNSGNGLLKINPASEIITLNIKDYVSNEIGISFDWSQNFYDTFGTLQHATYPTSPTAKGNYSDYDFDVYLNDTGGNDVLANAAATGDCPEFGVTNPNTLGDGTYEIFIDQYKNGTAPLSPFTKKGLLTVSKYGVWSYTIEVPFISTNTFSQAVATLTKTGNKYELRDLTDKILASGRINNLKPKNLKRK